VESDDATPKIIYQCSITICEQIANDDYLSMLQKTYATLIMIYETTLTPTHIFGLIFNFEYFTQTSSIVCYL
jgi:hypothetical protein